MQPVSCSAISPPWGGGADLSRAVRAAGTGLYPEYWLSLLTASCIFFSLLWLQYRPPRKKGLNQRTGQGLWRAICGLFFLHNGPNYTEWHTPTLAKDAQCKQALLKQGGFKQPCCASGIAAASKEHPGKGPTEVMKLGLHGTGCPGRPWARQESASCLLRASKPVSLCCQCVSQVRSGQVLEPKHPAQPCCSGRTHPTRGSCLFQSCICCFAHIPASVASWAILYRPQET